MSESSPIRILWHWLAMGPYHFARMSVLAKQPGLELTVIETTATDDHGWARHGQANGFHLITLSRNPLSPSECRATAGLYRSAVDTANPDLIVESGYADPSSRRTVLEYRANHPRCKLLLWSESTEFDHRRYAILELAKKCLVRQFDGALVAGQPHRDYMVKLGMPPERIAVIGGCVDNQMFRSKAETLRSQPHLRASLGLPDRYFLYVGRFIPPKNLLFLLEAYRQYRNALASSPWDLVLVGDGCQRKDCEEFVRKHRLDGVHFKGTIQPGQLPAYYAFAGCFVLPSISEPWGLVVNEAMASGTPVLVSNRCGCVVDLITPGVTGLLFDPMSVTDLATKLQLVTKGEINLCTLAAAAQQRVDMYSPDLYGQRSAIFIRGLLGSGQTTEKQRLGLGLRLVAAAVDTLQGVVAR